MEKLGYYLVSLLVAAGLVLSACAAPRKPAATPERPAAASPAPAAPQLTREQRLIEGAKKEGEVSFWVTTIGEKDKLIGLFQAKYPFLKLKIWDTIAREIVTKMAEEAKVGRRTADVVILSTDVVDARAAGLLAEYDFPNTAGWTDQPKHKYYIAFAAAGRAVAYNTDLVSASEIRSWDDVKSAKWAGKTMIINSGTDIPLLWAYLWRENDKLNWDRSFAFWGDAIRNTRPRIVTSYNTGVELMAAGEAALFIPSATPSTMRVMAKGAPVGFAPLGATPISPVGLALVNSAPHPNAAQLFIDWLTSPEGLLAYADPTMFLVLDPKVQQKARANRFLISLGMKGDLVPAEVINPENLKKSVDFWLKAQGVK